MEQILVTVKTLAKLAGISTRQVWRDVKLGACPPPIRAKTKDAHWSVR
jgi:predicted DNA-binding transcriptional regulator AlpA